jgi:hypothetical protein
MTLRPFATFCFRSFIIVAASLLATLNGARANDVSQRLEFVSAYLRSLSGAEEIRVQGVAELSNESPEGNFSSCIHSTQLQMHEMADAANLAATFKFGGDSKDTPSLLVKYFATKGEMYNSLGNMCETMLEGPKPGVDYGKIAAAMPKLRADMEYCDKNLLPMTVLVFNVLIRETPDRQGHMSRLIITRQQRDQLVRQINEGFKGLNAKNANYVVSSAAILKDYLTRKGYKYADEPD